MLTRGTLLLTLLLLPLAASGEGKIGFINSEAIMQALPEAQDAQRGLDALVTQWEGELQKMQDDWKRKFEDYDRKKLILTEQSRAEQERTLRELDQSIVEFRNRKFGQNGELFTKQNEVMKPIQNKLFKVLEEIAAEDGFDYIVDRSGEVLILYANPKLDLTSKALQRMQTFGR